MTRFTITTGFGRLPFRHRATHERNPELHRVSALRVGIAIAIIYGLLTAALVVTP